MPPKTARSGWKTGEQLEFLLSRFSNFKRSQDEKTLDRFWPRLFEDWYDRWPVPANPTMSKNYGSPEANRLMAQKAKKTVRRVVHLRTFILLTRRFPANQSLVQQPLP